jgi:hypothetical protein
MNFVRLTALTLGTFAIAACGASGEFLFGEPVGETTVGAGGATATSGAGASSNVSSSVAGSGGSTASSTATSSSSTSTSQTSASTVAATAASTVASTAAVTASSSSGAPVQTLSCGNTTCNLTAGEGCCWDNHGLLAGEKGACVSGPVENDTCNTLQVGYGPETRIDCQTSDQCASGKTCCARRNKYFANNQQYTVYDQVTCEDTCGQFGTVILCIPNVTACPVVQSNQGPVQTVCKASQLLPTGYYVCGNP